MKIEINNKERKMLKKAAKTFYEMDLDFVENNDFYSEGYKLTRKTPKVWRGIIKKLSKKSAAKKK